MSDNITQDNFVESNNDLVMKDTTKHFDILSREEQYKFLKKVCEEQVLDISLKESASMENTSVGENSNISFSQITFLGATLLQKISN